MTTRILDPQEWPRLAGTLTETATKLDPRICRILVVENGAGEIVGAWSLFCQWHAEALWIDPAHRKRGVVFRRLLAGMQQMAWAVRANWLWGSTVEPEVMGIVQKRGGAVVPGQHFVVPVGAAQE